MNILCTYKSSLKVVSSNPQNIFGIFFTYFYNSLTPSFPPKNVPIPYFLLFLPYMHVFIVFLCHCNHAAARCSQDGIIGENVCDAYFSQGLSLANYRLMEARDSHQLHAFFLSHAWTLAKAQLALSAWCCLWQQCYWCPEKWYIVAHVSSY